MDIILDRVVEYAKNVEHGKAFVHNGKICGQ